MDQNRILANALVAERQGHPRHQRRSRDVDRIRRWRPERRR